jgi:hypothetical protein
MTVLSTLTVTVLSILLLKTVPISCLFIPRVFFMATTRLPYISFTFNGFDPCNITPDLLDPVRIFKLTALMLETKIKQRFNQIGQFGIQFLIA